jgi:uncharacterized protein (TIGR02271 family)
MQRTNNRTVAVGVFRDQSKAQQAIRELKQRGFTEEQIGVTAKHEGNLSEESGTSTDTHADTGAGIGAATGLGVGGLWGLGIMAGVLPAIGPAIAGGALATLLTSAAAGAATGGLLGALAGMGIPEDEAEYYSGEFERGGTIVTVRADNRYDEARGILQQFGAYDIQSQREGGETRAYGTDQRRDASHDDEGRMELREERLRVRPEETRTGEVELSKEVTTERQTVEVPVEREEVVIRRHPTSSEHRTDRPIREGEEIRVPVKEERARVEKETVSRGEVSVEKRKVQDTKQVSADVKKEKLKVEKHGDAKIRKS